ncbi:MAG: PEP/pyruvate-binding domain-containing protein [Candidatus Nanohaloarchaea archaeon]
MVQWKGEITREESGRKAAFLDSVSGLDVPNFFTLTKEDVNKLLGDARTPEQVLNTELSSELMDQVKSEYKQIGMSSEVREASGKAKSLVGGQRDTGRVSVRISNDTKGVYEYKLNVGISDLENAIKKVVASYYRQSSEPPAVIIQKMVEPGYTGAAINSYSQNRILIESVEGLGNSLEQGITTPTTYLVENGEVKARREPDTQIKITRNPMNGQHRRKRTEGSSGIPESKVVELSRELQEKSFSAKFVYKRGTFYIVDAFKTENLGIDTTSLKGVRVSPGPINGEVGREVTFSDQTMPPEEYDNALISRKGGFISTDAQKARREGKPAIFSYRGELEKGQKLEIPSNRVESRREETSNSFLEAASSGEQRKRKTQSLSRSVTATEVLPIDGEGRSIHLSPPFGEGYSVGYTERENTIPSEGYLTDYSRVFAFNGDEAVVDARKLPREGLKEALKYIDADLKILLVEQPDQSIIQEAVRQRFDVIASQIDLERLEKAVMREEKRFILDKLTD